MYRMVLGMLILLGGVSATAAEPYFIIDYTKVDTHQYCVFNGQIYTRGIRIKTDTGTYTCRVPDTKQQGQSDAGKEVLSWVREVQ